MKDSIDLEIFDTQKINEHIAVGTLVYTTPEVINVQHLRWKHLLGPYGPSNVVALRNTSKNLIGRSFVQPRKFCLSSSKSCNGGTVTDLIIAPDQRNAVTLIAMTKEIKSPKGFDVVIHTSNEISDLIYRRLFKFPIAFTLSAVGLPIRIENILKPHCGNPLILNLLEFLLKFWRISLTITSKIMNNLNGFSFSIEPPHQVSKEILNQFRQHAGCHFDRSIEFLNWRFLEGELFKGKVEWVWVHGKCIGYIAFRSVKVGELQAFVLMDAVFNRPLSKLEGVIIKFFMARLAVIHSCDVVFVLANMKSSALKWLKGFPFVSIPDKRLPHSTPIFIHASKEFQDLESQDDMFFTLADLDYF